MTRKSLTRSARVLGSYLTLFLIAFLISFGIGELIVRIFVPVRNVGPAFTTYDPFYGKRLKKGFSTRRITPEFTMRFTTNSDGFRGPEIVTLSSRPILFLGDSFTMGYGVNDGMEFPALVRKALIEKGSKVTSVINAGMGNCGNGFCVKFLRTECISYNPYLIVLQLHFTDFQDNISERLFDLGPEGELIELPVPPQSSTRRLQSFIEAVPGLSNSYIIGLLRQISLNTPVDSNRTLFEEQLLFRMLEEILSICKDQEWEVLAVLADIPDKRLSKLERFFSDYDVLTVVIPSEIHRPDLYYKVDGHWNASGYRFTADRILEILEESYIEE